MGIFRSRIALATIRLEAERKPEVIKGAKTIWAHIATTGTYRGYRDGSFTLSKALFDTLIQNFYSETNPLPVYLGHADDPQAMAANRGQEPEAYGWIVALSRQGTRLFAQIELTKDLAGFIDSGKFRFTSIYLREEKDRKTGDPIGPRLVSLAVTNQPFLDGQIPLALSQKTDEARNETIYLSKDIQMTEKQLAEDVAPEEASEEAAPAMAPEEMIKLLEDVRSSVSAAVGEELDLPMAVERLKELLAAEEPEEPAEEEEALPAEEGAASTVQTSALQVALSAVQSELSEVKAELAKYQKEATEGLVDRAIKEGRIIEKQRADYLKLANMDRALFDSLVFQGKPAITLSQVAKPSTKDKAPEPELDPRTKAFLGVKD